MLNPSSGITLRLLTAYLVDYKNRIMIVEIKDDLNNVDINLAHITKVIEEKTNAYPNFNIFLAIEFVGGGSANLKGWSLDKWRTFRKSASQ